MFVNDETFFAESGSNNPETFKKYSSRKSCSLNCRVYLNVFFIHNESGSE